ncbi:hypothetical protein [Rhodovulum sulfidophilum]|uniref:D-isomer specific 2-hydroxyacid dehydrogenase catalytic domain-containing protein n=1 Tax=Rhodovulum sulfidophilum TaxID=35806 RepID=A0ABS1RV86_RHOSU|nr:hypothetical protein [Rhodovulum sulfidophilum]MBL3609956.1 hypothetical protein [Rhodovulum sulfidophilum]MCE8456458.1 hypothetical protein [Rhodovulum sulfidophilum]
MSRRPVVETDDIFPERTVAELSGAEFLAHQSQDPADVAKAIRSADMAVVQFAPDDDAEVITGMAEGGALIRYGIGFGNIDVTAANDRGLPASHVPSCCIDEVAGPSVSAPLRKPPALAPSARAGGGDGMADTAMMRGGMTEAQLEGFRPAIPIGSQATWGALDAPTVFLLSSRARDNTGARLHVNGSQSMV